MKNPLGPVAVVTAVTVANILLCFLWPVPAILPRAAFEWVSIVLVCFVIGTDGLLVSIALHGRKQLRRRVEAAYVAPILVAAPFVGFFWFIAVADRFLGGDIGVGLLLLTMLISIFAIVLRKLWRETQKRSMELDAEEWLRQRRLPEKERQTRASRRVFASSLFIPAIMVLPVFLFLHELMAIRSHVVHSGATRMGEYRITVPWTWMVLWHDSDNVYGVALRGTIRAGKSYFRAPVYLFGRSSDSSWYFRNERAGRWYPRRDAWSLQHYYNLVETRDVAFNGGTMHCTGYVFKRQSIDQPEFVDIECTGPQSLTAGFGGELRDREAFYRILSDVKLAR